MERADFFISYSHADRAWAEWVAWVLEESGYRVVVQSWDFRPGTNFVVEMQRAAAHSGRLLALLSPDYLSSRYTQAEWAAAFAEDPAGQRGRLIPVRIRPVRLEGLFAQIVYIDLVGLEKEQARRALLEGLRRDRAKPSAIPQFPGDHQPEFPGGQPSSIPLVDAVERLSAMPLDRVPAPAPLPAGSRVPFSPDPHFVDREEDLRAIARYFGQEGEGIKVLLVRGGGGIGKTALAAELSHRYGTFFAGGVHWINCTDGRTIPAEIASCGGPAGLALRPDFENLPLSNQVRLVQAAWKSPVPRLLVFDGCEDWQLLERWIPEEGGCRILVTSRNLECAETDPFSEMQVLALRPLSIDQGVVLLRRCQLEPMGSPASLAALSAELEGLPLALQLASGLLEEQDAGELLRKLQGKPSLTRSPLPAPVVRSLEEAFGRLDEGMPVDALARSLAFRAAYLAPSEPIPKWLLAASFQKEEGPALEEALNRLQCLGLLASGDPGVVLHPWVAAWLREKPAPEDRQSIEQAVYLETKRCNEANEPGRLIDVQAHLRVVTDAAINREDLLAAQLCEVFAQHLRMVGDREGALPYLKRAVAIREKLGPDDLELAGALESLGSLLGEGGGEDLKLAREAYERALRIRTRPGKTEKDSLALARAFYDLGLIAQSRGETAARSYFEEAVSLWERLRGPNAPDTIAARNRLHFLLGEQGLAEKEFLQVVPWGKSLLGRLRGDGAFLTQIRAVGPNRWILRSRLPEDLQEAYGTAPEALFLAVHDEVKGQDLLAAQQELQKKDFDVDPDLLVISDDRPRLKERLDRLPLQWGQWIPWTPSGEELPSLADQFRQYLPLYDVFERRDPVRGRQVIGRNEIVSDLKKRVQQGQAVGVFGLRKVGKTTVVRAVTDWLDPLSVHPGKHGDEKASVLVAWLDMERLYERTLDSIVGHLRKELERRLALESPTLQAPALPAGDRVDVGDLLEAALEWTDLPICVVLDEYDLLFEGGKGQSAISGVDTLFRIFRAVAQKSGRLSLVVIGRDSGFFENPEMNGWPNPMLNWIVPRWLGPLAPNDADELLAMLGRRVLLAVGPETASLARSWTGGHPLLHRQFGSALLEKRRSWRAAAEHVPTDPFCCEAVDLFLARDAVITICREVSHLLTGRYPEAAALLEDLCSVSPQEVGKIMKEQGGWHRPETRLLRNFGLLLGEANSAWVPEVYRWYLRTQMPQAQGRRA